MAEQDPAFRSQPQRARFFPGEGGKPRIVEDLHSFTFEQLAEYSRSLIPDLNNITLHESEKHPQSCVVTGSFPTKQGESITLPLGVITPAGLAFTTLYPLFEGEYELLEDERENDPSGDFPTQVFELSRTERGGIEASSIDGPDIHSEGMVRLTRSSQPFIPRTSGEAAVARDVKLALSEYLKRFFSVKSPSAP